MWRHPLHRKATLIWMSQTEWDTSKCALWVLIFCPAPAKAVFGAESISRLQDRGSFHFFSYHASCNGKMLTIQASLVFSRVLWSSNSLKYLIMHRNTDRGCRTRRTATATASDANMSRKGQTLKLRHTSNQHLSICARDASTFSTSRSKKPTASVFCIN